MKSRMHFPEPTAIPSLTAKTVSRRLKVDPSIALESYVVCSLISSRNLLTAGAERGLQARNFSRVVSALANHS